MLLLGTEDRGGDRSRATAGEPTKPVDLCRGTARTRGVWHE